MQATISIALVLLAWGSQSGVDHGPDGEFRRIGEAELDASEFPYPHVPEGFDTKSDGSLPPRDAGRIQTTRSTVSPTPAPGPAAQPAAPPAFVLPQNETAGTPLAQLVFTQDYLPGTRDANGQSMGGTEVMWLAGHDGKLFAAIGYGQDRPEADPKPGAQVIRKDAPDAPWQVGNGFGPGCMRVEGLTSFAFTTDVQGKPLSKPARLLIASPSELARAGGTNRSTATTTRSAPGR